MLTPSNKIIIVDNELEELYSLGKVFLDSGLTCKTFEYDQLYDSPLMDVRIAFFDINLNPSGGGSNEQEFATLAEAIKLYISPLNKPYVLIFWTKHRNKVDEFITYINKRNHIDIPIPFLIDCIDKLEVNNSSFNILQKLDEVLNNTAIQVLFDFENSAYKAASNTINRIFEIIPSNDKWGEHNLFSENFEMVFSKIASHSIGFEHAKERPDRAIYEALLPILNYEFIMSCTNGNWSNYLKSLVLAQKDSDLSYPLDFEQSKLNAVFHIENRCYSKSTRGSVINCETEILTEFKKNKNEWIRSFVPFKSKFKTKEQEDFLNQIQIIVNDSSIIAVEISAVCDYSNNNDRINKYILGALINPIDSRLKKNEKSLGCLELGTFYVNGESKVLFINLNYLIGTFPEDGRLKDILFTLKKEIVDHIGNRYACHVSRIGITSF